MTKEKESGLTKLIELLNEYENTLEPNEQMVRTENGVRATSLVIISKQYGFIKWLVENEKIEEGNFFYNTGDLPDDDVSKLLMLLAIKDEPIEFLVSILK